MKEILEMIMRVTLPEDAEPTSVMTGPGDYYASEIAHAGNEFAYSIYRNSKLPLAFSFCKFLGPFSEN